MGWANDALEREFAKAGIFPMRDTSSYHSSAYNNSRYQPKPKKEFCYYEYDFPTEAQTRMLRFITMHTGVVYKGKSRKEAKQFISENIDYAREMASKYDFK